MSPDALSFRQHGAGLPVALFIITVLALLVASMAQVQESSGQSVSLQIQSQRAFYAATSAAEVGVAQVLAGSSCDALQTPLNFASSGLADCRAELSCESVMADIRGNGTEEAVYSLTSIGRCGGGLDAAQRTIEVRVR